MKEEIAKRWADALDSGEYKQGHGALRTASGKFCCLGVLCDLYAKDTGRKWSDEFGLHDRSGIHIEGESSYLPEKVCEWAGATGEDYILNRDVGVDIVLHIGGRDICASKANDDYAEAWPSAKAGSFSDIAEAIRDQIIIDHEETNTTGTA